MLNYFLNSLPTTRTHWLATGHGFQVHTAQAFVPAGQHEYGAASHGPRHFGPALLAHKLNLRPNAQFAHQRFKSRPVRPFSDDAASKLGKGRSEICERFQNQVVAFIAQQVANHQNLWTGCPSLSRIGRKKIWIYAVVHDGAAGFSRHSGFQTFLHFAADTDYGPRHTVDVHGRLPPPDRRNSTQKARVKYIQPMECNHERNIQSSGKQRSCVAARQGRVSVDNINPLHTVQLPYSPLEAGVEQLPRAGQPEISGNLRISHPFRRCGCTHLFSRMVNRGYSNHARLDTRPRKLLNRFSNEAAADLIFGRRKKWRERQNMHCSTCLTGSIHQFRSLIELIVACS